MNGYPKRKNLNLVGYVSRTSKPTMCGNIVVLVTYDEMCYLLIQRLISVAKMAFKIYVKYYEIGKSSSDIRKCSICYLIFDMVLNAEHFPLKQKAIDTYSLLANDVSKMEVLRTKQKTIIKFHLLL